MKQSQRPRGRLVGSVVLVSGIVLLLTSVCLASGQPDSGAAAANRVLRLDGRADYVYVPGSESLRSLTDAMTIEVWFKASSFYTGNGNVNSVLRKNLAAGEENFFLRFRNVSGTYHVEMTPGLHIGTVRAPYRFVADKWYHLAGVYDGSSMTVFVNGVRIGTEPFSGSMRVDDSALYIGKGDPEYSFGEYFHGVLDELRIWKVARSQKEIHAAMNATLTGGEAGLLAYWNFDDGTAEDLSPHGNDGQLREGAGVVESPRPTLTVPPEDAAEAAQAPQLTTEERLEVLEALWRNLRDIYPALEYKGVYGREWIEPAEARVRRVESDADFYGILLEQMASLKDTHTCVVSYPGRPRSEAPPVALNVVEGKVAVIRADAGTKLKPGDVIVSVDGRAAEECLDACLKRVCNSTERGRFRAACGQLLQGIPGSTVTVTVQGEDGGTRSVELQRTTGRQFWREPAISSRSLGDSVGYVRISRWVPSERGRDLAEEFDRILEEFKNTKGLVIDVRGNGGGSDQLADVVNGRLTDTPVVSSIDFWRKAGSDAYEKSIGWVRPRGPWAYRGRVAVLIDEACASACEHFVSGIEAMGYVLLVGTPTNGAGGGPTAVTLPDGTRVAISRALGLRANGVVFEGHGIPPHIFSTPTLDDLRSGRDAALDIARDWILSGKAIPPRAQALSSDVRGSGVGTRQE